MSPVNNSTLRPSVFLLLGIPGLETVQHWIAVPLCFMYGLALLANCIILFIIKTQPSLHEPMYLFLAVLAMTDLILATSTVPKMLSIFWQGPEDISFNACLTQMFFIHAFTSMESGILVGMALDRYVAICHPLRHTEILKITMVAKLSLLVFFRSVGLIIPFPLLLIRQPFCEAYVIPHSYCEHMALVKLVCADTVVNTVYGLAVALLLAGMDTLAIALSYLMILQTIFNLPSDQARVKALSTCASHICVMLVFYVPGLFSFLVHRFGQSVPHHIHIVLANLYLLAPPTLNPIVYGVKTKQIRVQVTRLFYKTGV